MTDIVDSQTRSRMMSGIRGVDTAPELCVRKYLHANGFRFRLHANDLPGKPDLVLPKYSTVIMVHGCFWHRHSGCRYTTTPATRRDFWQKKFDQNVSRDTTSEQRLRDGGWRVAIVWECSLRERRRELTLTAVGAWIVSQAPCFESCLHPDDRSTS